MKKVFKVFMIKCEAAGRYVGFECLLSSRLIFSLLIVLNAITGYYLLFGRKQFLAFVAKTKNNETLLFAGCMAVLYFLFSVIAPKGKIESIQLNEKQVKQIFVGILAYAFLTEVVFFLVLSFRS